MLIFHIKRIILSEKWCNYIITFFFLKLLKNLDWPDDSKCRKKEDGLRYFHFSLIYSLKLFNWHFPLYRSIYHFQTLFTYKETMLFCPKFFLLFSLFSATSRPFLSSLPFFFLRTRHRGFQAKAWCRARNILAQLCFTPDDSQHYRNLGVDASLFLPYSSTPILLHTPSILLLLPFFP